jgi:hypothetical protein
MQLIPSGRYCAAQVKPLIQQGHGLPLSSFVGFFLTYQDFDLTSQQPADGARPPGSDDFGLSNRFPVETDRQILFRTVFCSSHSAITATTHGEYV